MDLEPLTALLLFAAGFAAGFVDAIAGGGGLIAVPALLAAGLPPQLALGTNKLQGSAGTALALWHYARAGLIDWNQVRFGVAVSFVSGAIGTAAVTRLDPGVLRAAIPVLLLAIAGWLVWQPHIGTEPRPPRLPARAFALLGGSVLGFYDGFFGPGTGSFWTAACLALRGHDLRTATGYTKAMNLASNAASLIAFAIGGQVAWRIGLVMIAGQLLGARLGARLVIVRGTRFIRPVFLMVVIALAIRLLLDPA